MCREVDILLLSCAGGELTRGLVNADVLKALGPKGTLINIARGTVVDEPALIEALQTGGIAGAGLDVFASEPEPSADLIARDNVVLYPHHASGTVETRDAMAQLVVDNLAAFFAGKPLLTPVNLRCPGEPLRGRGGEGRSDCAADDAELDLSLNEAIELGMMTRPSRIARAATVFSQTAHQIAVREHGLPGPEIPSRIDFARQSGASHALRVEGHAPAAAPDAVVSFDQPGEVRPRGFVQRFHAEAGHCRPHPVRTISSREVPKISIWREFDVRPRWLGRGNVKIVS